MPSTSKKRIFTSSVSDSEEEMFKSLNDDSEEEYVPNKMVAGVAKRREKSNPSWTNNMTLDANRGHHTPIYPHKPNFQIQEEEVTAIEQGVHPAPTMRLPATAVSSEAASAHEASSPSSSIGNQQREMFAIKHIPQDWPVPKAETGKYKCPTKGCDGNGHVKPYLKTHKTLIGCPYKNIIRRSRFSKAEKDKIEWHDDEAGVPEFKRPYLSTRYPTDETIEAMIGLIPEFDDLPEWMKRKFIREIDVKKGDTATSKLYSIYACRGEEEPILVYVGKTHNDERPMLHFTYWMKWSRNKNTEWITSKNAKERLFLLETIDKFHSDGYKFRLIQCPYLPNPITTVREAIITRGFIGKHGFANQIVECADRMGSDLFRDAETAEVACTMMQTTWATYADIMQNVPLIDHDLMSNLNWKTEYTLASIKGGSQSSFRPETITKLMHKNATRLRCLQCEKVHHTVSAWLNHMKRIHKTFPGEQGLAVQCKACRLVFSAHQAHPFAQFPCTSNRFILVRSDKNNRTPRPILTATPVFAEDINELDRDNDDDYDEAMDSNVETIEMQMERDEDEHEEMEGDMPTMRLPATAVSSEAAIAHAASSPSSASSLKCEFVSTEAVDYDNVDNIIDGLSQRFSQTNVSQSEGEISEEEEEGRAVHIDYDELTLRINGVPRSER